MNHITKPMLAGKCERPDALSFPVLATPKLDGIRCLKIKGRALTRSFKPVSNRFTREWIEGDVAQRASRPWDRDRDGFVVGEGAGMLILEELDSACRRNARILAELVGYGMSADAFHVTAPPDDGDGAYRVMRNALRDAGIRPEQVQYINAHGTSTEVGDRIETAAIKRTFGEHAYRLAVSSTKSMTGHLLGGAGGLEAGITVLALRDQIAPPTMNLENPDAQCDLDYLPNCARPMKIEYALSNSFGFGGTNGCLIFKRYQE